MEKEKVFTEDFYVDCGFWFIVIFVSDYIFVNVGVVNVGIVDGESRRKVIVLYYWDSLLVRGEFFFIGGELGDVFIFGIFCY